MIKQYITVSKTSDLDWRIKLHKKYEVIGRIGDFYFVWANGHQSVVQSNRIATIENVKVMDKDTGGGYLNESKRAWEKGACHRRSKPHVQTV